jgi:hypothetical protein
MDVGQTAPAPFALCICLLYAKEVSWCYHTQLGRTMLLHVSRLLVLSFEHVVRAFRMLQADPLCITITGPPKHGQTNDTVSVLTLQAQAT